MCWKYRFFFSVLLDFGLNEINICHCLCLWLIVEGTRGIDIATLVKIKKFQIMKRNFVNTLLYWNWYWEKCEFYYSDSFLFPSLSACIYLLLSTIKFIVVRGKKTFFVDWSFVYFMQSFNDIANHCMSMRHWRY